MLLSLLHITEIKKVRHSYLLSSSKRSRRSSSTSPISLTESLITTSPVSSKVSLHKVSRRLSLFSTPPPGILYIPSWFCCMAYLPSRHMIALTVFSQLRCAYHHNPLNQVQKVFSYAIHPFLNFPD